MVENLRCGYVAFACVLQDLAYYIVKSELTSRSVQSSRTGVKCCELHTLDFQFNELLLLSSCFFFLIDYLFCLMFVTLICVATKQGHLDVELCKVRKLLSKFRVLSNFQSLIEERTKCCFLYWIKEMLSTWLSMVYGDACKLSWLQ